MRGRAAATSFRHDKKRTSDSDVREEVALPPSLGRNPLQCGKSSAFYCPRRSFHRFFPPLLTFFYSIYFITVKNVRKLSQLFCSSSALKRKWNANPELRSGNLHRHRHTRMGGRIELFICFVYTPLVYYHMTNWIALIQLHLFTTVVYGNDTDR